ncbi:DUF7835 family putative zinc beta-ribbon protein [Haladaptatus pallidirubidus]|uniref:DUF7835 family putative zinc beta-ribbon protein n=1 Tax=Haladaptatus pallidirubidus TaxID=1008152 RepID=UPI003F5DE3A2
MGAKRSANSQLVERCDSCAAMTPHEVTIKLITESEESQNAVYSHEPYRITECQSCAATSKQRMNDM